MKLTERQEQILKAIVEIYTSSAHPVGSQAILSSSGLHVSSATVRHEMAELEELGYVRQLHTSGGRVPTNAGYRYYVEFLMQSNHLSNSEAMTIRHQFHQAHTELQEWLKLAATIMAFRMHNVGLVTAPKSSEVRLRHLEAIAIQSAVVLLIVVLQDGTVVQEMLTLPEPRSQEELSALADRLAQQLQSKTALQIESQASDLPEAVRVITDAVAHLLRRAEEQHTQVYHAGLTDMIQQPEFLGPQHGESLASLNERLRHMLDFLHQGYAVQRLLSGLPLQADVHVVVGGDRASDRLNDYSFVLGRYGERGESSGFLGIVGPTRMEYPRAVALVRYMSDLMTDLVQVH